MDSSARRYSFIVDMMLDKVTELYLDEARYIRTYAVGSQSMAVMHYYREALDVVRLFLEGLEITGDYKKRGYILRGLDKMQAAYSKKLMAAYDNMLDARKRPDGMDKSTSIREFERISLFVINFDRAYLEMRAEYRRLSKLFRKCYKL